MHLKLIPQAQAAITNKALNQGLQEGSGATFGILIQNLWRTMIILGGIAFLLFTVWGGVSWILAGGDKGKVEAARDRIIQGLIGLGVLAATAAVARFVGPIFGLDLFNLNFPTAAGGI